MRRLIAWLSVICAAGALALLATRRPAGLGANFDESDFAALIGKIGFLVLIGGAVLTVFRERFLQTTTTVSRASGATAGP